MKKEELAKHIGDVGDDLVDQAEYVPNYAKQRRSLRIRAAASVAAAIVLMVTSFTTGALAFSRETVIEVPVEQEIITLEGLGISLILPESWKGRYVVEGSGTDTRIFTKSIYDYSASHPRDCPPGLLFGVSLVHQVLTPEEYYAQTPVPSFYLFASENGTYDLWCASDVEYPLSEWDLPGLTGEQVDAMAREYQQMYAEIGQIQLILNGAMAGIASDRLYIQ